MKTTYPVLIVLALGVAGTMWGMSGIAAIYDGPQDDLNSREELNESAEGSSVNGYEADAGPNQGGNIVGLIFSGISRLVALAGLVLILPAEMHNIGFPWWFSLPIGLLAQTLVGIGIVEFATQREWT